MAVSPVRRLEPNGNKQEAKGCVRFHSGDGAECI